MGFTIRLSDSAVELIDQRLLPEQEKVITTTDYRIIADAICTLAVRGAPAIGVAAAFGIVLAARAAQKTGSVAQQVYDAADVLAKTRPTAVNLFWAIKRMRDVCDAHTGGDDDLVTALEREAQLIFSEDVECNNRIGDLGADLLPDQCNVLTHCNAGALATAGYGTALGVIRSAHRQNKLKSVFADETRPLLQGARLTAWELMQDGIDVTVITDSMAGYVMSQGMVDAIVVGADRIAANGDVANKIGTYTVAVLAKEHSIPMYVAAPRSTIDTSLASGKDIPIEERSHHEVVNFAQQRTAPEGVGVFNPAFDVTPHKLITAIICETGVIKQPYEHNIAQHMSK